MKARRTTIKIYSGGSDVTALYPLESFKYSSSVESEADTVELELADVERVILENRLPARGSAFTFVIYKHSWNTKILTENAPSLSLPLGSFELDEIDFSSPPTKLKLKLTSVPNRAGLRGIERSRSYEETNLQKIAADIAGRAGLRLVYDVQEEIEVKRAEQSGESDLSFLEKLCKNNGLNLKLYDNQIVIFDAVQYESLNPVIELTPQLPIIIRYSFKVKSADIYDSAAVSFLPNGIDFGDIPGVLGDIFTSIFDSATVENGGSELKINQKTRSTKESERLAKAKLRDKNKKEFTLNLTVSGSFSFMAGNNFTVKNFGDLFDGKYICDRVDHSISNGYTTQVTAHKILGY